MPRPKGSKNKSTLERETVMEQPKPFNYEEDDSKFDSNYQMMMASQGAVGAVGSDRIPGALGFDYIPTSEAPATAMTATQVSGLFLVEGEVQLSSREPGRGAMVAKQMRLVSAANDDQAIQKFVRYFAGLSDAQSVYTVINAAAMETIQ